MAISAVRGAEHRAECASDSTLRARRPRPPSGHVALYPRQVSALPPAAPTRCGTKHRVEAERALARPTKGSTCPCSGHPPPIIQSNSISQCMSRPSPWWQRPRQPPASGQLARPLSRPLSPARRPRPYAQPRDDQGRTACRGHESRATRRFPQRRCSDEGNGQRQRRQAAQEGGRDSAADRALAPAPVRLVSAAVPVPEPALVPREQLERARRERVLRRLRDPAGCARRQDVRRRTELADQRTHPDPVGPALHQGAVRFPSGSLESRARDGLVLVIGSAS